MIINKASSDSALVGSLVLLNAGGTYITGVATFDTESRVATLAPSGTDTAEKFWFAPSDTISRDEIAIAVEAAEEDSFLHLSIRPGKKFAGKRAMDNTDSSPDNFHRIVGPVRPVLVQCSNCDKYYIVYVTQDDRVFETERASASDKHLTATEIADPSSYACDGCSETVMLLREE